VTITMWSEPVPYVQSLHLDILENNEPLASVESMVEDPCLIRLSGTLMWIPDMFKIMCPCRAAVLMYNSPVLRSKSNSTLI